MPHKDSKPAPLAVSLATLAQRLDASRCTIRRWLREADIRPVAMGRGKKGAIRYMWRDVQEWLESRQYVE